MTTLFLILKLIYQEFIFTSLGKIRAFYKDMDITIFINLNNQTQQKKKKGSQIFRKLEDGKKR